MHLFGINGLRTGFSFCCRAAQPFFCLAAGNKGRGDGELSGGKKSERGGISRTWAGKSWREREHFPGGICFLTGKGIMAPLGPLALLQSGQGYDFLIHTIGDRAARMAVDAIEAAAPSTSRATRHRFGFPGFLSDRQPSFRPSAFLLIASFPFGLAIASFPSDS